MQTRGGFLESERHALLPRLISPLVHNLNNSLAVFAGACDGVRDGLTERTVRFELDHMGATLNHLALFAKSHAAEPELVDLRFAVDGVRRLLEPLAGSLGITVHFALPATAILRADPARLEQLLIVLVGEQLLELGSAHERGAWIRIRVRTGGRGGRGRVTFALTRRALSSDHAPSAAVRAVAAASNELGMHVSLRTIGAATCVRLSFACELVADDSEGRSDEVDAVPPSPHRARKLLLIEQDESLAGLIGEVLAEAGYDVSMAFEMPALASLTESRYELILLDAGVERSEPGLFEAIATHAAVHARVILLGEPREARAFDDHVLPKPFRPHELLAAVRMRLAPVPSTLAP